MPSQPGARPRRAEPPDTDRRRGPTVCRPAVRYLAVHQADHFVGDMILGPAQRLGGLVQPVQQGDQICHSHRCRAHVAILRQLDDNSHSQVLTLCWLPTASGRVAWAVSRCPQLPLGRSPPGVTAAGLCRSKRFARRWWRQSNLAAHRRFHRDNWVAKGSIRLGTQTILVWNGLSSGSRVFLGKGFGGAPDREVRGDARGFEQATGPGSRTQRPQAQPRRTVLDAGVAAATSTVRRDPRRWVGRGSAGWVGVTCRG